MEIETQHVKYVFADIVDFTKDRTVEAQVEIIDRLGKAFKHATQRFNENVIYLPTGDGICVGITDAAAPADAHLQVALAVLSDMHEWSSKAPSN